MKRFTSTILALILTGIISQTTFAGQIAGGRMTGHIPGGRAAGHITTGRTVASPNRTAVNDLNGVNTRASQIDLESATYEAFAGLIRMLLDAGALL